MDLRRLLALTVASATVLAGSGCGGDEPAASSDEPTPSDASRVRIGLHLRARRAGRPGARLPGRRQPDRRPRGRPEHRRRDLLGAGRARRRERRGSAPTTGRGSARARRSRRPTRTPGRAARPTPWPRRSPQTAGEQPPYVVVGWSYGGMVAQAFATRHPDLTAGLVLEDSSVPEQFVDKIWDDIDWEDGGRVVDEKQTLDEIGDGRLRRPARGRAHAGPAAEAARGRVEPLPGPAGERVDERRARPRRRISPHEIHVAAEDLVLQAVEEVAAAVEADDPLAPCDDRFAAPAGAASAARRSLAARSSPSGTAWPPARSRRPRTPRGSPSAAGPPSTARRGPSRRASPR